MTAEATADNAMNLDATEAKEQVTAAVAASRVDSVLTAQALQKMQ
jgi:hypothetical protein